MRAQFAPFTRRPCKLKPGEVRRLACGSNLIGLTIACPVCGFHHNSVPVSIAGTPPIVEENEDELLRLQPGFRCAYPTCQRQFEVVEGEYVELP